LLTQHYKGVALEAELIVLTSWDQLDGPEPFDVEGKIVLMNVPFTSYGAGSTIRRTLAVRAAAVGAVAALVRSVTPFSLRTYRALHLLLCVINLHSSILVMGITLLLGLTPACT
jgi:hypothetical protein